VNLGYLVWAGRRSLKILDIKVFLQFSRRTCLSEIGSVCLCENRHQNWVPSGWILSSFLPRLFSARDKYKKHIWGISRTSLASSLVPWNNRTGRWRLLSTVFLFSFISFPILWCSWSSACVFVVVAGHFSQVAEFFSSSVNGKKEKKTEVFLEIFKNHFLKSK
jgi:hypothetical protein